MAVIFADKIPWQGRGGGYELNVGGSNQNSINRTVIEMYRIVTDNKQDGLPIVLSSSLVPQPLSPHDEFPLCLLTSGNAIQHGQSPTEWIGTFKYTSLQPRQPDDNPLNRPDIITSTGTPTRRVVYQAVCGQTITAGGTVIDSSVGPNPQPITNSALDPFQTPLEDDSFDRMYTIQRNVAYVPDWVDDLEDTVNDDAVMLQGRSCDEATLRFFPLDIGPYTQENNIWYYQVTMKIGRKKDGWDWLLPDQGTQCYGTDGNKRPCVYKGVPVTSPVNLDGGQYFGAFGQGAQLFDKNPMHQVFLTYQRPRGDFSQLRLPAR